MRLVQIGGVLLILVLSLATPPADCEELPLDRELRQAATQGKADRVAELLKQGADPNAAEANGRSALCEAVGQRDSGILQQLLHAGAKPDPSAMWQAGWLNKTEMMKLLLAAGGNPDQALPGAAQGGHVKLVEMLLEQGADPNPKETRKGGSTALHGAALQGGLPTVQRLLKAGADPNAINTQEETPLHSAIAGDANLEIVKALVEAGAKLDVANEEGLTPVRMAAQRGGKELYEWLLKASGGKEPRPKSNAASPLSKRSTGELIKALQTQDNKLREQAQRELVSRGKQIMPEVLKSIEDGGKIEYFLGLFAAMGTEADDAWPKLEELLGDKRYVFAALVTMRRMKTTSLDELSPEFKQKAAQALYEGISEIKSAEESLFRDLMLAELGEVSTPYFLKLLRSEKHQLRYVAASTFGDVTAKVTSSEIQSELLRIAREDEYQHVRVAAIRTLGRYGKANKQLKQTLLEIIKSAPVDSDGLQRRGLTAEQAWKQRVDMAGESLGRFGPELIDDLLPLLTPIENPARIAAMTAIERMDKKAIPRLKELLDHEDKAIVRTAEILLSKYPNVEIEPRPKSKARPAEDKHTQDQE